MSNKRESKMHGRKRSGNYPHSITLRPKFEREAQILMSYDIRNLSNLVEKAIHVRYGKLPQAVREKTEAEV